MNGELKKQTVKDGRTDNIRPFCLQSDFTFGDILEIELRVLLGSIF